MMQQLYPLVRPLLWRLDPERAHRLTIQGLRLACRTGIARLGRPPADDPILASQLWGMRIPNPIGLAAGFDKDAEVPDSMLGLGFGFVETGSVTPRPQPGNDGKRLWRLEEDRAVINRFGFNSQGLEPFVARLAHRKRQGRGGIVGANLGKNKETEDAAEDYAAGIRAVAAHADYLVVNVSSPNTAGLRDLQSRQLMADLLGRVVTARAEAVPGPERPPLLVKIAPDLDDAGLADIAEVAVLSGIDGIILGNTTLSRPPGLRSPDRNAGGGLSGAPLTTLSTERLAALARLTQGRIPLIGCGGVASGADAYAKIRAGASLVQLYSGLVYDGPGLVPRIKAELAGLLRRDSFASVTEAVGADLR